MARKSSLTEVSTPLPIFTVSDSPDPSASSCASTTSAMYT